MSTDLRLPAGGHRVLDVVDRLGLPLHAGRFWLVQAGVLFVAFLDEVVLDVLGVQPPFEIPRSTITALLLIPVIYAALSFGVRGAVGTALWATLLMFPDWLLIAGVTSATAWVEIGNLAILNGVAIIVGQRVEREGQSRQHAEEALRASELAETRYRGLFDEQHAPVLVTDAEGLVTEANAAATSLLGTGLPGRLLADLVHAPVTAILDGLVPRLRVKDRVFVPKARALDIGSGGRLVQIVLVDVTEEEHREREQQAYASHLVTVQEDERRRLAQDLHDDPVQTLTYLVRMLELLGDDPRLPAELGPLVLRDGELATEVVDALRAVIHGLRPPVLDDLGVVAALRQLVAEVRTRHRISIRLQLSGDQIRLSDRCELTLYRVAQEALSNVVRHAQAARTRVELHFGDQVVLTVSDDGRGIPVSGPTSSGPTSSGPTSSGPTADGSGGGLGLIGMRERVNLIGGSLEVLARKPHGTMVRVTMTAELPGS